MGLVHHGEGVEEGVGDPEGPQEPVEVAGGDARLHELHLDRGEGPLALQEQREPERGGGQGEADAVADVALGGEGGAARAVLELAVGAERALGAAGVGVRHAAGEGVLRGVALGARGADPGVVRGEGAGGAGRDEQVGVVHLGEGAVLGEADRQGVQRGRALQIDHDVDVAARARGGGQEAAAEGEARPRRRPRARARTGVTSHVNSSPMWGADLYAAGRRRRWRLGARAGDSACRLTARGARAPCATAPTGSRCGGSDRGARGAARGGGGGPSR